MKAILKRIFPFVIGGAVVVFAACQDGQTPTEPPTLQEVHGPPPQVHINLAINRIWSPRDPDRSLAHSIKSAMFDAVDAGDAAAAQAAAEALIALAVGSGADMAEIQDLVNLVSMFAGLTPGTVVEAAMGGVVTDVFGEDEGFAGVEFEPGDLPQDVVVIVEQQSQPCHPLAQLPNQEDGCFSFRTIPELTADFANPVLVGVCTDLTLPNLALLRLFESQGPNDNSPVVLLDEDDTPDFLVPNCTGFMASTESSWLGNFARTGWETVGRPLASLLTPEPLHATTFLATSGSLGGRTKNFSNIGWAEVGLEYGTDGYRYIELDRGDGDTPPAGFETPGFDDSGWSVGGAPFWDNPGDANCAITPDAGEGTTWAAAGAGVVPASQATEILLRRRFVLPEDASNVKVGIAIDNDLQVFVNGVELTDGVETHEGCATEDSKVLSIGNGDLTIPGVNLLVVRAIDRGVMGYVDAQVTFDTNGREF